LAWASNCSGTPAMLAPRPLAPNWIRRRRFMGWSS
jgi:hypothetical protein